ncbi:hypothetical protein ACOIBK_28055, partial [Klebsiella pneumoniae]|uniref:hypothetical protein n=1 Tax=Klebsiella pneumoniae TaxID=573 RepID=UPI003B5CE9DD
QDLHTRHLELEALLQLSAFAFLASLSSKFVSFYHWDKLPAGVLFCISILFSPVFYHSPGNAAGTGIPAGRGNEPDRQG